MKYKWIFVLSMAAVLAITYAVSGIEPEHNRYHQHLEAAEKAPCTDHDDSVFCTHLPLIEIVTDEPVPEPFLRYHSDGSGDVDYRNYEMVAATVRCFDSETENNHLTDTPVVEERAQFRIRGANSRKMDKTAYLIKFREKDMVTSLNVPLCGMSADSSWALHAPFLDKSLIRNYLCYNLAGEIMEYAPNCRFCELFVNGEYKGVYLLVEKIGYSDNGRINITKTDPDLASTSYVIQVDRGDCDSLHSLETFGGNSYIYKPPVIGEGNRLEILYPGKTLTQAQKDYITMDFSQFEKALFSYDYNDPDRGWRQYIDARSIIDFFLINEFTLNYDVPSLSTYIYKDVNGKLKMCVWDFDGAFDNFKYTVVLPESFTIQNAKWFKYLFKDETFVDQVVDRYQYLRNYYFNEEYLFQYIDDVVSYLGPAIERNNERWGYSFQSTYNGANYDLLIPEERNVRSYEEAVQQIKDVIAQRINYMDSNLDRLYILCHESMNKRYNQDREGGGLR